MGEDVGRIVGDPIATTTSDPTDGTYDFTQICPTAIIWCR